MITSKKQKAEIYEASRKALAKQSFDSMEYGTRVFYPNATGIPEKSKLEANAENLFKQIDGIGDYAIHNIMGILRYKFREVKRNIDMNKELFVGEGGDWRNVYEALWRGLMAEVKFYLPQFCYECRTPLDDENDTGMCLSCHKKEAEDV